MEVSSSGAESQPIQELDPPEVKKKRGRPPRVQPVKSPPAKMNKEEDEDVCFICFDGGSLVLCDRRGCPKAYHPACVKRDEAFFRSKAKWNCGWHICSVCQKAAHHMCFTCTYSLCKGCMCIKKADYVCVRGDKGFCTVCMRTIMLIENGGEEKDEKAQVDFDDKTSWEYLFKVYWIYLKGKLSLTLDEITQAKNPQKEASTTSQAKSPQNEASTTTQAKSPQNEASTTTQAKSPQNEASTTTSVIPSTCVHNGDHDLKNAPSEAVESKRRKTDEHVSIVPHKETVITKKSGSEGRSSVTTSKNWATKELLEFVAHMKNGDTSVLSQFDVQELMLEYIKRNNLRDPRKKSQIVCDSRLKILFGKPRVGHFEMLKLLEFHFFINEDLPKKAIKSIAKQIDPDWNIDNMVTVGKEKKRKNHKKAEERTPQNKLDDYAAIDVHNINLIYLRRKFMENLIEDRENFQRKVVGSIVRIRITGSDQKHDMYRLVQVVGTSKADATYKIGNKSADIVLEVLNLDKKETVSIDKISNQDLSEDECRRLRQSIKCGLVKRFTVGEIQDKAVSIQSVRLNDLMEAERLRLNNLRDRASEKGHKKGLREYVEKLQLLKTPEERERRLREIPEVHSDPKMSPDYESDDTEEYFNKEQGENTKPKYTGISRKNTSLIKKGKDFPNNVNGRSWKNEEVLASTKATGRINLKKDAHGPNSSGRPQSQVDYNGSTITNRSHNSASETSTSSYSTKNTPVSDQNELDKVWHYRDPSGKIQGPFCMLQLQKWSTTGYFPQDMRIWRNQEDESLLLTDVLKQQASIRTATEKVGVRVEGLTVRTTNLSFTQKSVNYEKVSGTYGSTGQSSIQNWIGNGTTNTPSIGRSNESNTTDLASPTPAGNGANTNKVSVFDIANADLEDLPSPTPKETPKEKMTHVDEKVQNAVDKEAGHVGKGPKETMTHADEKVQNDVDKEAGNVGGGPKETTTHVDEKVQIAGDKEVGNVGGGTMETTIHVDEKAQNAVDKEVGNAGGGPEEPTTHVDEKVQNAVNKVVGNVGGGPKEMTTHVDEKVQNAVDKEAGNVGGAQLPKTEEEWTGYSSTDHVVTASASMEQVIHSSSPPSSQPGYNSLPEWQGVRETIEFSTLAEESVSDLLAEVDAMESQNGFPSPTSRRNSFVEDLFNGSFDDFSPTPLQGHLPFQQATSTAATTAVGTAQGNNNNLFDFVESSTDLQCKWPDMPQETISKGVIDVNNSIKADVGERETNATETSHDHSGGSNEHNEGGHSEPTTTKSNDLHNEGEHSEPTITKSKDRSPELVLQSRTDHKEVGDGTVQPAKVDTLGPPPPPPQPPESLPPPQPVAVGTDKVYPRHANISFGRPAQEIMTQVTPHLNMGRGMTLGWDPHQQTYGGERFNSNSPRERSYRVEDSGYSRNSKPWVRQSSFGGGSGGGGSGYSRAPPKGQRVCKFYESGRCKKGASCNYWHP